jgi:hypothetical protein
VANLEAGGYATSPPASALAAGLLEYLEQSLGDVTGAGTRMVGARQGSIHQAALRRQARTRTGYA